MVLFSVKGVACCACAPTRSAEEKINKTAVSFFMDFDSVLLITKRVNRVEPRRFPSRIVAKADSNGHRHCDGGDDGGQRRHGRPIQKGSDGDGYAAPH